MAPRRSPILATAAGEWVGLHFAYDPFVIGIVRSIPGANFNEAVLHSWAIPLAQFMELVDTVGVGRVDVGDDHELSEELAKQFSYAEPTYVLPDFAPLKPTYTQLYHQENGLTAQDFQAVGTSYMVQNRTAIIADDMGLGKSKQFIDTVWYRFLHGIRQSCVLLLAKQSNVDTWNDEIEKFCAPAYRVMYRGTPKQRIAMLDDFLVRNSDPGFLISSYDTFRNDVKALREISWDTIGIDEAHKVKSSPLNDKHTQDGEQKSNQSKIAAAIHDITAPFKYALTGTPIINSPEDAWNILVWLELEDRDFPTFERDTLVVRDLKVHEFVKVKKVVAYRPDGMRMLRRRLHGSMIRRLKSDKLDLPPKQHIDITVTLNAEETRFYKSADKSYEYDDDGVLISAPELLSDLDNEDSETIPNKFVRTLRLTQITSSIEVHLGKPYNSSKLLAVQSLVEDIVGAGHKVGVFSQFRSVTTALERELAEYNPAIIHGGVTTHAGPGERSPRQLQNDKFQNDPTCKVVIGTSQTCREGLTLTAGSFLIHVDKEWSPAYVTQLEDRLQRIGQVNQVTVYSLQAVLPNGTHTVDYRKEETLSSKEAIAQELVG